MKIQPPQTNPKSESRTRFAPLTEAAVGNRGGWGVGEPAIAALLFLASKFPHRQFNLAELCVLSGVGRTAMSQIKNAKDTPFSLGKCTLQRLDAWLANHPGFKQE